MQPLPAYFVKCCSDPLNPPQQFVRVVVEVQFGDDAFEATFSSVTLRTLATSLACIPPYLECRSRSVLGSMP